jgi:hypothetical protein
MNKLLRRHISVLIALGIYWPFLFWLTHIPVPAVARQSGMSDKSMHVMAYFLLTFLIWFAISPYQKVQWNKAKPWCVILAVILYGVIDEVIQAKVGRSGDVMDFMADLFGVVLALGLLSILGFWGSLLTVSAVFIFVLSDISRLMTLAQYANYATVFHFTAYSAFALIWVQWLQRFSTIIPGKAVWLTVSFFVPMGLLAGVKLAALALGRPFDVLNSGVAVFGITAAVMVSWVVSEFSRKSQNRQEGILTERPKQGTMRR